MKDERSNLAKPAYFDQDVSSFYRMNKFRQYISPDEPVLYARRDTLLYGGLIASLSSFLTPLFVLGY